MYYVYYIPQERRSATLPRNESGTP